MMCHPCSLEYIISFVGIPSIGIGIAITLATKKGPISAVFGYFFVANVIALPIPIDGLPLQQLIDSKMNSI
jgi:hypothetical protein